MKKHKLLVSLACLAISLQVSCAPAMNSATTQSLADVGQETAQVLASNSEQNSGQSSAQNSEQNSEKGNLPEQSYLVSNLLDEASRQEVETALLAVLDPQNVKTFMEQVVLYNRDVQGASLHQGFQQLPLQEYDIDKLSSHWEAKHPQNPGTNCRINSFLLLQDNLTISDGPSDAALLFIDRDSIQQGHLLDDNKKQAFERLFSQVDTVATKDVAVHAQKMEAHLQSIQFPDKAAMISLVTHDNLDGDKLFIGHVGVLVPFKDQFLFVEKLSFVEPYQAIVFAKESDVYDYMLAKFGHYYAEDTAKPFVMKNAKAVRFS